MAARLSANSADLASMLESILAMVLRSCDVVARSWQNCPTVRLSNYLGNGHEHDGRHHAHAAYEFNFGLGEVIERCASRCGASRRSASRRAPTKSTAAMCFPATCGRKWANSASSGSPSPRGRRRRAWAISLTPWRWRRSRAPRPRSGLSYGAHSNLCVNQCASTRPRSRSAAICRS